MRLKCITELLTYILSNRFDLKLTLISIYIQSSSFSVSKNLTKVIEFTDPNSQITVASSTFFSLSLCSITFLSSLVSSLSHKTQHDHILKFKKMLLYSLRKLHTGQLFTFPPEPVGNFSVLRLLSRLGDSTLTKIPARHILKTRRDGQMNLSLCARWYGFGEEDFQERRHEASGEERELNS